MVLSSVSAGYNMKVHTMCSGLCGTVSTVDLSVAMMNKKVLMLNGQFCSKALVSFDSAYPKSE